MSSSNETVAVVGAGLAGSMMAVMLARRGFTVEVYEKRSDFRKEGGNRSTTTGEKEVFGLAKESTKRSINLALSHRGRMALKEIGLHDQVMEFAIPMKERAIHLNADTLVTQPYGQQNQAIYSVSRTDLNHLLLDSADTLPNVTLYFQHTLKDVDADGKAIISHATGQFQKTFSLVIGADGAYSATRSCMSRHCRQNFSQYYIPHGYKELSLPPIENDFALTPVNALHIWPREKFMLIALPNPDKSFTCTLFAPYEGLLQLETEEQVLEHFQKHFPDIIPLIPNLAQEYLRNPTGSLATMRVEPWNLKDKVVLIGDAAHAIVPFYGQGMNAAFEDCLIFNSFLDKHRNSLSLCVREFAQSRKPSADALADLSFYNYIVMRQHTASWSFRLKKRIEAVLHRFFPSYWIPLYTMVSFTRIPYEEATEKAKKQDWIISTVSKGILLSGVVFALRFMHLKRVN